MSCVLDCCALSLLSDLYVIVFCFSFFFFNDTATTEIYTLSLHDALPILAQRRARAEKLIESVGLTKRRSHRPSELSGGEMRSEEHTSELQSLRHLVCRLLLEKKKKKKTKHTITNKTKSD